MSPPEKRSGPAGNRTAPEQGVGETTNPERTPIVGVACRVAPPVGDRKLYLVVVLRCCFCSGMHAHRSGAEKLFGGQAFRKCPATGQSYLLLTGVRRNRQVRELSGLGVV